MTVNVWPPMVRIPVRAAPGLAATVNWIVADPVPLPLPALTVSHAESLVAVHVQLVPVVSATLPEPPVSVNDCPLDPSEYVHACVI